MLLLVVMVFFCIHLFLVIVVVTSQRKAKWWHAVHLFILCIYGYASIRCGAPISKLLTVPFRGEFVYVCVFVFSISSLFDRNPFSVPEMKSNSKCFEICFKFFLVVVLYSLQYECLAYNRYIVVLNNRRK